MNNEIVSGNDIRKDFFATKEEVLQKMINIYEKEIKQLKKENEQLKEKIKNVREKFFNLLSDYEIGNYDNNIHQFYKDVYYIHNELMELAE